MTCVCNGMVTLYSVPSICDWKHIATRQHVGKTTVSLALMSGLQKRFDTVGFIKPVGQQHVTVPCDDDHNDGETRHEIRVDKDVCLVKEHFHLHHLRYADMSPVLIPKGYTKQFVQGEISVDEQVHKVHEAMHRVSHASHVVLCEGTGHTAVGSIVALNNAQCAKLVGADMVLVANGGLGSAFDEVSVLCLCVLGVLVDGTHCELCRGHGVSF